jgi:hypothetical protein
MTAVVVAVLPLLFTGTASALPPADRPAVVAGEAVRSASCDDSKLASHTGFQSATAQCVHTDHGEVSDQTKNPTLLIVEAPDKVRVGQDITLKVSTRNLVRDRFLPAGQGGYYLERAELNGAGLTRGHFHVACQLVGDEAPQPDRNASFKAVEDGGGGAAPDTVKVTVPGLTAKGDARCAAWAGDSSHRTPLMAFANQIPAFDVVDVQVRGS